jgi:hypothetical protein
MPQRLLKGISMKAFLLTFLLAITVQAAGKSSKAVAKPKAAPVSGTTQAAAPQEAGESVVFKAADGKTEFLAIGKPAMIKINGEGQGPEGTLTITKNTLNGTVKVDLNKLTTKIDLRDDHMKNKYLEVGKYPEANLEFVNVELPAALSTSETEVPFKAKFTMHGKTSDVNGKAKVSKNAKDVSGNAEFLFKITDHLDTLPTWLGVKVAEEVTVKVQLKGLVQ